MFTYAMLCNSYTYGGGRKFLYSIHNVGWLKFLPRRSGPHEKLLTEKLTNSHLSK